MTPEISAVQIAQQKLQDKAQGDSPKQGPSKFDAALDAAEVPGTGEVDGVDSAHQVEAVGETEEISQTRGIGPLTEGRGVEAVGNTEKTAMNGVDRELSRKGALPAPDQAELARFGTLNPPEGTAGAQKADVGRSGQMMTEMLTEIEKGQGVMDRLIKAGISGKNFSQTELLALQASVYKYTQELELTGKVVEKATSGLKDTLKTQV